MPTTTESIQFWNAGTKLLYVTTDAEGKLLAMARVEVVNVYEISPIYSEELVNGELQRNIQSFRARYLVKSTGKQREARNPIQKKRQIEEGKSFTASATELYTLEAFIELFKSDLMQTEHHENTLGIALMTKSDLTSAPAEEEEE